MTLPRARHALPVEMLLAGVFLFAGVGAGCKASVENQTPPQAVTQEPTSPTIPLDYALGQQETETIVSPDRKWTAVVRSGPDESFDLIGPAYIQTVLRANGLEFSPDSRYFIYLQAVPFHSCGALFAFDTINKSYRQITNTNLPPPPLTTSQQADCVYGPLPPITWSGHLISWLFDDTRYKVDLDTAKLLERVTQPSGAP